MNHHLIAAEWLRFRTHPGNRWVVGIFFLVFLVNAVWSGWNAREYRQQQGIEMAEWRAMLEDERQRLVGADPAALPPGQQARAAFDFARHAAPPAQLPVLEGLALSTSAFKLFSPVSRVTITNRQADDRNSETLTNPQLEAIGEIDFSTLTALLLPILCICLGYGLLQEDRESGIWRLTTMTHPQAWQVLGAALFIRWAVAVLCLMLPSALAFGLDPGSSLHAYLIWVAAGAGFAAAWTCLGGLFCLLPISAGAVALALLAAWIVSSFVLPAALGARDGATAPSRMASIATLRVIQLDVDEQGPALLEQWYARNGPTPAPHQPPAWPVSFMPRYEAESLRSRVVFRRFDTARVTRDAQLESWAWLSPGVSLLGLADRLAGIDAARYRSYTQVVDEFEDRWRAYFTPRVMFYRGLAHADIAHLPAFDFPDTRTPTAGPLIRLWLLALALLLILLLCRHRANSP